MILLDLRGKIRFIKIFRFVSQRISTLKFVFIFNLFIILRYSFQSVAVTSASELMFMS